MKMASHPISLRLCVFARYLCHERVVEDGNLITSRGAATSVDFGLALKRRLCGDAAVAQVAKGIMA